MLVNKSLFRDITILNKRRVNKGKTIPAKRGKRRARALRTPKKNMVQTIMMMANGMPSFLVQADKPAISPERKNRFLLFSFPARTNRLADARKKYVSGISAVWNVEKRNKPGVASKRRTAIAA